MTTATTGQDFGLEAWMRPFREAMTAFQGSAFPGGFPGAFPGSFPGAFPGMGGAPPFSTMAGWFGGQAAPTPPGWMQGLGVGPASGAFTGFLQQLDYAFPMPSIPQMGAYWEAMNNASKNIWDGADVQKELDACNAAILGK